VIPSSSTSSASRCWGWIADGSGAGGTHGLRAEGIESVPGGGGIDGEHHSTGTVATLLTVNPNRCGVIDANRESWERGSISTNWLESRVEAVHHRAARAGEGGLSGRMVFLVELKSDGVSWLGSDVTGRERENTSTTHDDTVVGTSGGR